MKNLLLSIFLAGLSSAALATCLNDEKLDQIKKNEIAFQLQKNPPPFKHALETGQFKLEMKEAKSEDSLMCNVKMLLTLAEQDVRDATAAIDAIPAKRIMLSMQGYVIPESPYLEALFSVNPKTLEVPKEQFSQTAELGRTRATIELIYATLANIRGVVNIESINNKPWNSAFINEQQNICESTPAASKSKCECRLSKLAKHISQQQMETINYLQTNPYSIGSASLEAYKTLNAEISKNCESASTTQ